MKTRTDTGFTLLELVIAMGILAFILASFLVMISTAGQLMVNNKRDLQRAYTKLAVWEIVMSNPKGNTEYPGFFPTSWPDGASTRTVNSIKIKDPVTSIDTDILQYSKAGAKEWKAVVSHEAKSPKVLVEVDVLGQIDEKDY